jgi:hypothetical protein
MDLTGFGPAPATLTGCRASVTPQAHACNGNGETCVLHVHPSRRSPGIPEMGALLEGQIVTRRKLLEELGVRTVRNCCFPFWPVGILTITFGNSFFRAT